MKYENITDDDIVQMLQQRQRQYEQEHFNHQVNLELIEASGANDEAAVRSKEEIQKALKTLDDAHTNTAKKIKAIKDKPTKKG